jgi:hypothetical protein
MPGLMPGIHVILSAVHQQDEDGPILIYPVVLTNLTYRET